LFISGASGKNIAAMFREPRENPRNLRRSLPFPKDHFWHSSAQRAVMVDLGEPEIFEGKMAQTIDRFVRRNCAFADFLEKLANGFCVQVVLSNQASAFSSKILA
jgi:hypothetical protein